MTPGDNFVDWRSAKNDDSKSPSQPSPNERITESLEDEEKHLFPAIGDAKQRCPPIGRCGSYQKVAWPKASTVEARR